MKRLARIVILGPVLALGLIAFTLVMPLVRFIYWALDEQYEPGMMREMWGEWWGLISS